MPATPRPAFVIGYNPFRYGAGGTIAVLAVSPADPPSFRLVHERRLDGMPWMNQAEALREVCATCHPAQVGIDTTGQGWGVWELVRESEEAIVEIVYTEATKRAMADNAATLLAAGRLDIGEELAAVLLQEAADLDAALAPLNKLRMAVLHALYVYESLPATHGAPTS